MLNYGLLGGLAPTMAGAIGGPNMTTATVPPKKLGFLSDPANKFGMLNAAAAMLQASGPSTTKVGFGQALGQGLQSFAGGRETYLNNDIDRRYKEFLMTKEPKAGDIPANIQIYQLYQDLQAQDAKDGGHRANDLMNVIRGGYTLAGERRDPRNNVVVDINTTAETQRKFKEAEAGGAKEGTQAAEAAFDIPQLENELTRGSKYLDELVNHPAAASSLGMYSIAPVVPGTPRADFVTRLEQLQGQSFLTAYQQLKGGGQISEFEGKKADAALNRMRRATSIGAFKAAAEDFKEIMRAGLEAKRRQAKQGTDQFDGFKIIEE